MQLSLNMAKQIKTQSKLALLESIGEKKGALFSNFKNTTNEEKVEALQCHNYGLQQHQIHFEHIY